MEARFNANERVEAGILPESRRGELNVAGIHRESTQKCDISWTGFSEILKNFF